MFSRKKVMVGLGIVSLVSVVAFPIASKAFEPPNYVNAPSINVRESLAENISQNLSNNEKYNRLEDFEYTYKKYGVIPMEYMEMVTEVDADWDQPYLNGLEYAENLESLSGEFSGELTDLSSIKNAVNLKNIMIEYGDNTNLKDLKKLSSLENLNIYSHGISDVLDDEIEDYDMLALYDISAISELPNLKKISISTCGLLQTVTLKKGTTTHEMYSPVIKSSQFGNSKINYHSATEGYKFAEKDGYLKWENIDSNVKYLVLDWNVSNGNNVIFNGRSLIPINWID